MSTLADMTEKERAQCVGLWCENEDGYLCIYKGDRIEQACFSICAHPAWLGDMAVAPDSLIPRYDLPRAWQANGQPPAGEWEHAEYLGDYKGISDVYHLDGDPTHRRWIGEWETIEEGEEA